MLNRIPMNNLKIGIIALVMSACVPSVMTKIENKTVPERFTTSLDSTNTGKIVWKNFFTDKRLITLIDSALKNNQDLNIVLQEISISKNEIRVRKGKYLPFVDIRGGAGAEKAGRYTRNGAVDGNLNIRQNKAIPTPLPDYLIAATTSWEIDSWKKLRNAKKAATYRYLSSIDGKNFMVTHLVAEIASAYYELMAFDNQLEIVRRTIDIQKNALQIITLEKEAGVVTELAVKKFQAEVLKNQGRQYHIQQQIVEMENTLNFLIGRYPKSVERNSQNFNSSIPDSIYLGLPSQLLANRPDIKQSELQLAATKLDVKSAKANFYPSLRLNAGVGYQAFNPKFLINTPASIVYSFAGELAAPLVNRNEIKAVYLNSSAKQLQAVYNYEKTILSAYIEIINQLNMINNLKNKYEYKEKEVQALTRSISISTNLFKSAKADYMEVLMTQRDALESNIELIETKRDQMVAMINTYRALGGGWK